MRPLGAGYLDRMTHLDNVDPVGIERLRGERVEAAWRRRRCSVRHPADNAAGEKRHDHRRGGNRTPRACAAGELVEVEARRDRFGGEHAVACADRIGLRPPLGDAGGIFRMGGKPGLDGATAICRNLVVDIGVKLVLGHG